MGGRYVPPALLGFGGLAVGFLAGWTFSPGADPDWQAIGALGTMAAVFVALIPIYRAWRDRRRTRQIVQEQTRSMILSVQSSVAARVDSETSTPLLDPLSETETQQIMELGLLVGQLGWLDRDEYRTVLSATAGARMLATLSIAPVDAQDAYLRVAALLDQAAATVDR